MANDKPTIEFDNVCVTLSGVRILENVTAQVPKGGCTAIVGPNGAGKTTLLLSILGNISYDGKINFHKNGEGGKPRIGYVPQRLTFDRGLPLTVLEFLTMGSQRLPLWLGIKRKQHEKAEVLLEAVKATHLATRQLGALSGGELQRILLALALQQDPQLLILDEPAAGVDLHGDLLFCELLEELREKHDFTQLMVSHDLGTVTHHASYVICLNRKVQAAGPPNEVLTPETLSAVFGMHMGLVAAKMMPNGKGTCSAPCCRNGEEKGRMKNKS